MKPPALIIGLVLAGLLLAGTVSAETYRWVDKDGTVHFTDNPYELPEPQRSKVIQRLEKERKQNKDSIQEEKKPKINKPIRTNSYVPEKTERRDPVKRTRSSGERLQHGPKVAPLGPKAKKRWQDRAAQARKRYQDIQARCAKLKSQQNQGRRQHLLFGRPGALANSNKASAQLPKCKEELEKAREFLEEKLPEQARRAGVPKRWVE